LSADQTSEGNKVRRNALIANGAFPAPALSTVFGDRVLGLGDDVGGNHNNCMSPNTFLLTAFLTDEDCMP
jgi:hypothetical protein